MKLSKYTLQYELTGQNTPLYTATLQEHYILAALILEKASSKKNSFLFLPSMLLRDFIQSVKNILLSYIFHDHRLIS